MMLQVRVQQQGHRSMHLGANEPALAFQFTCLPYISLGQMRILSAHADSRCHSDLTISLDRRGGCCQTGCVLTRSGNVLTSHPLRELLLMLKAMELPEGICCNAAGCAAQVDRHDTAMTYRKGPYA